MPSMTATNNNSLRAWALHKKKFAAYTALQESVSSGQVTVWTASPSSPAVSLQCVADAARWHSTAACMQLYTACGCQTNCQLSSTSYRFLCPDSIIAYWSLSLDDTILHSYYVTSFLLLLLFDHFFNQIKILSKPLCLQKPPDSSWKCW